MVSQLLVKHCSQLPLSSHLSELACRHRLTYSVIWRISSPYSHRLALPALARNQKDVMAESRLASWGFLIGLLCLFVTTNDAKTLKYRGSSLYPVILGKFEIAIPSVIVIYVFDTMQNVMRFWNESGEGYFWAVSYCNVSRVTGSCDRSSSDCSDVYGIYLSLLTFTVQWSGHGIGCTGFCQTWMGVCLPRLLLTSLIA